MSRVGFKRRHARTQVPRWGVVRSKVEDIVSLAFEVDDQFHWFHTLVYSPGSLVPGRPPPAGTRPEDPPPAHGDPTGETSVSRIKAVLQPYLVDMARKVHEARTLLEEAREAALSASKILDRDLPEEMRGSIVRQPKREAIDTYLSPGQYHDALTAKERRRRRGEGGGEG